MSLPYPSMTFVPLDVLTADEMNQLVANIESLADGSGLDAGAIGTSAIANSAITSELIDWSSIEEVVGSGNSIAIRYANGWQTAIKRVQGTVAANQETAFGSLYEGPTMSIGEWASPFIEVPFVTLSAEKGASGGDYFLGATGNMATATTGPQFSVLRPNQFAMNYRVTCVARGHWK